MRTVTIKYFTAADGRESMEITDGFLQAWVIWSNGEARISTFDPDMDSIPEVASVHPVDAEEEALAFMGIPHVR